VRVVEDIGLLCNTPAAGSGLKGEFEGLRRLRVGYYRMVYKWQHSELVILLVLIAHRREVCRSAAARAAAAGVLQEALKPCMQSCP